MAKKQGERPDFFWACVDTYVDDPETGKLELVKANMHRPTIICVNEQAFSKDGVFHPAVVRAMTPNQWHGVYHLPATDDRYDQISKVMDEAVKRSNGKIIGPYEDEMTAITAKHAARKQTPREQALRLTGENAALKSEVAELKKKLAEIEEGSK